MPIMTFTDKSGKSVASQASQPVNAQPAAPTAQQTAQQLGVSSAGGAPDSITAADKGRNATSLGDWLSSVMQGLSIFGPLAPLTLTGGMIYAKDGKLANLSEIAQRSGLSAAIRDLTSGVASGSSDGPRVSPSKTGGAVDASANLPFGFTDAPPGDTGGKTLPPGSVDANTNLPFGFTDAAPSESGMSNNGAMPAGSVDADTNAPFGFTDAPPDATGGATSTYREGGKVGKKGGTVGLGEFVVRKESTRALGADMLKRINALHEMPTENRAKIKMAMERAFKRHAVKEDEKDEKPENKDGARADLQRT